MTTVQLSMQSGIPIKKVAERCFQLNINVRKHISAEDQERIKKYVPEEEKFETLTSKINQ